MSQGPKEWLTHLPLGNGPGVQVQLAGVHMHVHTHVCVYGVSACVGASQQGLGRGAGLGRARTGHMKAGHEDKVRTVWLAGEGSCWRLPWRVLSAVGSGAALGS